MSEKRFKDKAGESIYSWVKTNIGREKTRDKDDPEGLSEV